MSSASRLLESELWLIPWVDGLGNDLRSDRNYVEIDPVKDKYGIPAARISFQWSENDLKTWEYSKQVCGTVLHSAGGEVLGAGEHKAAQVADSLSCAGLRVLIYLRSIL